MSYRNPTPVQQELEQQSQSFINQPTRRSSRQSHATVTAKASATILTVMQGGQSKHGDSWQTRDDQTDLEHAKRHLELWEAGDVNEPHLEHALTRLALILARQKRITDFRKDHT